MKQKDLDEVIRKHELWLNDESTGVCANLRRAELSSANLSYAELRGANLSYAMGNKGKIKNLQTMYYEVVYTKTDMAIGCEQHTIEEWFKFTDEEIDNMHESALEFWGKYKELLKLLTSIEGV